MIDNKVVALAHEFRSGWEQTLRGYSKYSLDFSWPSVGLVDHLIYFLRRTVASAATHYSEDERYCLNCAASYLAGITHDAWQTFPDSPKVSVTLSSGKQPEVVLTATGGLTLEDTVRTELNITKALIDVLSLNISDVNFFEKQMRAIPRDHNRLSAMVLGFASGMSPAITGPWSKIPLEAASGRLHSVQGFLAQSTARYYRNCFPSEPLGADPELYAQQLVLPPIGFQEQFPALRAITGLHRFTTTRQSSTESIVALCDNLLQSPDELLSSVGLAIRFALSGTNPPMHVMMAAESLGVFAAALRPAVHHARKLWGRGAIRDASWFELLRPTDTLSPDFDRAVSLFEIEKRAGLLPLATLPASFLQDPQLLPLWYALSWSQTELALEAFTDLRSTESVPVSVLLQGAFLEHFRGNDEATIALLDEAEQRNINAASLDSNARENVSLICLLRGNHANKQKLPHEALKFYREGYELSLPTSGHYLSLGLSLVESLIVGGSLEEGLPILEKLRSEAPHSVAVRVRRYDLLRAVNQEEAALDERSELERYVPLDRRVLQRIMVP